MYGVCREQVGLVSRTIRPLNIEADEGVFAEGVGKSKASVGSHPFSKRANIWQFCAGLMFVLLFCMSAQAQTWTQTGSLGAARALHTATLLPSGKMLVVGGRGYNNTADLATAELYDPSNGTWSPAASLSSARSMHTATLLSSGKVLVVGGTSNALASCEIYDPTTDTWSAGASLNQGRYYHTSTLLPSGLVLVVGGFGGGWLGTVEIYDPVANKWSFAAPLETARSNHTATLLTSGKVFIVAGQGNSGLLNTSEIYDPATNKWNFAGSLSTARLYHTATLLPSGKVLVAGGTNGPGVLSSAQIYDPANNTWGNAASLNFVRQEHSATALPSGLVLVAGWADATELYNPATDRWSISSSVNVSRDTHTATLLASGRVLLAGGYHLGSLSASAEIGGDPTSALLNRFTSVLANPGAFNGTWYDFSFGLSGDVPMVMQINKGELAKPVVYRPSNGNWYINLAGSSNFNPATTKIIQFGGFPGDVPQIVNVDGVDHIAIYRAGRLILNTTNQTFSGSNLLAMATLPGAVPTLVSETVSNGSYFSGDWNGFSFGLAGDIPLLLQVLPGDIKLPVVFRPGSATWYINLNGYANYTPAGTAAVSFGLPGDVPKVVYWNGSDHIAVYRPSTGQTFVSTDNHSYNGSNFVVF